MSRRSESLTPREREVFGLIANGQSNPGNRGGAVLVRGNGQDPCGTHPRQAECQGPRAGSGHCLRDRNCDSVARARRSPQQSRRRTNRIHAECGFQERLPCPQGTLLPPELRHRCRTNVTDLRHRLTALSREQSIYSQRHSARAGREACPTVPPPDAPSTRPPCAFGMRQHARRQGSQRLLIAKTDAIFRRIPVAPRLGITRHPERVALWQGVVAGQRNWHPNRIALATSKPVFSPLCPGRCSALVLREDRCGSRQGGAGDQCGVESIRTHAPSPFVLAQALPATRPRQLA